MIVHLQKDCQKVEVVKDDVLSVTPIFKGSLIILKNGVELRVYEVTSRLKSLTAG